MSNQLLTDLPENALQNATHAPRVQHSRVASVLNQPTPSGYWSFAGGRTDTYIGIQITDFVVPKNVYSICAVAIASGTGGSLNTNATNAAGPGGNLSWKNNIPVYPGELLRVIADNSLLDISVNILPDLTFPFTTNAHTGVASTITRLLTGEVLLTSAVVARGSTASGASAGVYGGTPSGGSSYLYGLSFDSKPIETGNPFGGGGGGSTTNGLNAGSVGYVYAGDPGGVAIIYGDDKSFPYNVL